MISKLLPQLIKRKFTAGTLLLLVAGGGYFGYAKIFSADRIIHYATAQVQKGTLVVSLSGSGQVSASNQMDIKPKASGEVVYIGVKNGQEVRAGSIIVQLDDREAQKAVRDAKANLESAKLSLEKMKLQHEQELRGDALNKNYEDGLAVLSNLYGEFSVTLDGLDKIFFGASLSDKQQESNIEYYARYNKEFSSVPERLGREYGEIKKLYQQSLADYQLAERGRGEGRVRAIQSGYELTVKTAEMIKTGRDVVRDFRDTIFESNAVHTKQTTINGHVSDLTGYAVSIDGYLRDLLTIVNSINNQRDVIESWPIDSRSQELTVKQRENAFLDAKEKLADYYVRAPFDGVVAKLDAKKGDSVSPVTILGAFITKQKIAEISLNEVDVAQIKTGQKATLTFDAIPDLTIAGQVVEIDTVGMVSQGIVTYMVKITFDTQDEIVKPGMSASAAIVKEVKSDVLVVPNSAVKSQGGMSYVELPDESDMSEATANISDAVFFKNPIRQQPVEIGAANDESTEILGGLKEGDIIVTRTIQPAAGQSAQTQQQSGGLRIPGLNTGGGGGIRSGGGVGH